jgi:hypothetical protein
MLERFFMILVILTAFGVVLSCSKTDDQVPGADLAKAGHPRILLLEEEEEQIRELIDSDETWKKIHFAILEESNKILGKPALERVMIGRRLLSTSRELRKRIFFLAYNYRMTGDDRFLNKAEEELVAVSLFSDWNPSHFLDVAEMTMGVAIGYDWLFADLSEETRSLVRSAILVKGINPSKESGNNSWLRSSNNWNQVCNAGMVYGALAVQEDYPELAEEIIDRAFETIGKPMEAYGPDGVYPEGYGYWGYGTTFNIHFLSAMEKAGESDRGLTTAPGFLETGHFLKHMLTPTGGSFNWADCGIGTNLKPAMFWFAEHTSDPSVLWSEKKFLEVTDFSQFKGIRELPMMMIWGKEIPLANITEPKEKFWVGQGDNPVSMMRSSWTSSDAVYMGFKAGSPSVNHGHMDIGSFIMEADGVRWAGDLGNQNYESLESLGMHIFGKGQDAERWTIFRMNSFSHNVLIIDDEYQRVDGYAKIDKHSNSEDFMYAISDISSVYNTLLKKAVRGVGMIDQKYTVIRDEIETLDKVTKVRWNMVTYANVELGQKEATLKSGQSTLFLKVQGPDNIQMKTWSTAPTNNYDAENPGTILVGFECDVPANASEAFEVLLVQKSSELEAVFPGKTLEEW